jgi:hypothetical protein
LAREEDAEFLFVEPNIEKHPEFPLTGCEEALGRADLVVKLVAHAAFGNGLFESCRAPLLDFSTR